MLFLMFDYAETIAKKKISQEYHPFVSFLNFELDSSAHISGPDILYMN